MTDYQWPKPTLSSTKYSSNIHSENELIAQKIEDFFSSITGFNCILMPSGRSSVFLLLNYLNVNRSWNVFAPKWTSHCLWDVICRLANPMCTLDDTTNLILAVHKWGEVSIGIKNPENIKVIEDSVDSLLLDGKSLFPNNGDFEILSLPKIIGSYTGGIIICRNSNDATILKGIIQQFKDIDLGCYQSKLRFNESIGLVEIFFQWNLLEYKNNYIDTHGLLNIEASLHNYEINKLTILKRLEMADKKGLLKKKNDYQHRLPPVLTLETDSDSLKGFMIRNSDVNKCFDKPQYNKVVLLPLHFGLSDKDFNYLFDQL